MKLQKHILCSVAGCVLVSSAYAKMQDPEAYALMTARDMKAQDTSKITITNRTSQTISASGLFIASFDVNDCSACYGSIVSGDNAGGAFAATITFKPNQSIPVGSNFLYNMIYNGIYYITNTAGSSPCSLPGCSWPSDDPNVKGWCISINAASINSSYTYSNYTNGSNPAAKFPAYSNAGNSTPFDYKYDLVNPATLGVGNTCLGPITCNDQTLTCKVANAQDQSFQAYS